MPGPVDAGGGLPARIALFSGALLFCPLRRSLLWGLPGDDPGPP